MHGMFALLGAMIRGLGSSIFGSGLWSVRPVRIFWYVAIFALGD
jgi:hypothetical protein